MLLQLLQPDSKALHVVPLEEARKSHRRHALYGMWHRLTDFNVMDVLLVININPKQVQLCRDHCSAHVDPAVGSAARNVCRCLAVRQDASLQYKVPIRTSMTVVGNVSPLEVRNLLLTTFCASP